MGAGFADHVGCPGTPAEQLACLRAADAQALVDAAPNVVGMFDSANMFFLVVDGFVHDQTVSETFRDSHPKPGVPVLLGTNSDEGWLIAGALAADSPLLAYDNWLASRFGTSKQAAISALYDPAWYPWLTALVPPRFRAIAEITSDWGFYRSAHHFVAQRAYGQSEDVYVYHFEYPINPPLLGPGAPHGTEIAYVFATKGQPPSGNEPALISAMQRYWKRFAATGAPEVAGLPAWPAIDAVNGSYLAFRDEPVPAVAASDWLDFGDLGAWRPDGMTKLELVQQWDAILEEGYTPPLPGW
jgi:para-nitrobenzyl esterase